MLYAQEMIKRLFANTVYVQVFPNRFELKHIESGRTTSALSARAFSTTRLLVGEFLPAEDALKKGIKALHKGRWLAPKPRVVIHPMAMTDDGLSSVEVRVLSELTVGAGARESVIWVGHPLSDQEVRVKARGG